MHQFQAYPKAIDRSFRHVFSILIVAVFAHMLGLVPEGTEIFIGSAASEQKLLAVIAGTLGYLLSVAVGTAFVVGGRTISFICQSYHGDGELLDHGEAAPPILLGASSSTSPVAPGRDATELTTEAVHGQVLGLPSRLRLLLGRNEGKI